MSCPLPVSKAGRQTKRRATCGMATYTIIPRGEVFDIAVVSRNGARQTILGFTSEAEAQAWISEDERLSAVSEAPEGECRFPIS